MSALPLLLGWLVLTAGPDTPAPAGYRPSGSSAELFDLGQLALLRDPAIRPVTFRPSRATPPRREDDGTVLADVDGPGLVQRLWIAREEGAAGPDRRTLRILLGRREKPALEVPLEMFFAGRHPQFPRPMVGEGPGGCYCDVPIPFRDGCKVVLLGAPPRDYQLDLVHLPDGRGLAPFRDDPTADEAEDLWLAKQLWYKPDELFSKAAEVRKMAILDPEVAEYPVDGGRRSSQRFLLPAGPRTIRSLDVIVDPETVEAWRAARLRITWDGDDTSATAVDLPLGYFYVQDERVLPHASLITSYREHRWANRFPMPYRRQAILRIDAEEPIRGTIRVRSLPRVEPGAGYFHAAFRSAEKRDWVVQEGRGHFIGMFLTAEGPSDRPRQLDHDLRFVLDGRPAARVESLTRYFNGAKDRPEYAEAGPVSGFPIVLKGDGAWRLGAFRWHATDPIPFARSLRVESGPLDVDAAARTIQAALFWYSEHPGPSVAGTGR